MLIYKIFRADEWAHLQTNGVTDGAPIDLIDGYIHFSDAGSVASTAALHFKDVPDLMLIAVEADTLAEIKWEPARDGTLFPHLYRAMTMDDVIWARPLPLVGGTHDFPELT